MALFTVDSNNIFGLGIQEAGTYNVKIVKAVTGETRRGQNKLVVDYEVIDGKYKGGQIQFQTMTWDDEDQDHLDMSIKRFNTFVVALGAGDGTQINSLGEIAQVASGRELSVETEWAEPNNKGQIYLQVRTWHKKDPNGSQPNGIKRPNTTTQKAPSASPFNKPVNSGRRRTSKDPFANSFGGSQTNDKDSVDISDDDLPF